MSRSCVLRLCLPAAVLCAGLSWSRLPAAPGDPPTFYLVERFGTNFGQVLVHFDTEADRSYTLEYTTNLLRRGNQIVQEGTFPDGTLIRWTFSEIKNDSFRWRGERMDPDGKTWRLQVDFRASRSTAEPI